MMNWYPIKNNFCNCVQFEDPICTIPVERPLLQSAVPTKTPTLNFGFFSPV